MKKYYIKDHKAQVLEIARKGEKYFSNELLEKGFNRLAKNGYYFDGKKGKLYGKLYGKVELIEEYSNQSEYNSSEAFDEALCTFSRNTRNQASMIIRGY